MNVCELNNVNWKNKSYWYNVGYLQVILFDFDFRNFKSGFFAKCNILYDIFKYIFLIRELD